MYVMFLIGVGKMRVFGVPEDEIGAIVSDYKKISGGMVESEVNPRGSIKPEF